LLIPEEARTGTLLMASGDQRYGVAEPSSALDAAASWDNPRSYRGTLLLGVSGVK
jgi:hypothetical protein